MKHQRVELVSLRKSKDWLQKDVVSQLQNQYGISITESYYGMIEQGARTPALNVALAIANLFGVDPNEIFFSHSDNKLLGDRQVG